MRERMGGACRSHDGHTSRTDDLSKPNSCCLWYVESSRCGFSASGRASWRGSKGEAGREPRQVVDFDLRKKREVRDTPASERVGVASHNGLVV